MSSERLATPIALATGRRRPPATLHQRVGYELARLRAADTREPEPRFAHLARSHD